MKFTRPQALSFLLCWIIYIPLAGQIYVDATASGVDNGSSWVDAFSDLQDALTVAAAGDQIWVANGTYKPINCSTCTTPDRLTTFNIPSDVEIYGGFNGSETALEQRDWTVNFSILSGDIGLLGDTTDNSYRVVTAVNSTDKTIFDGLIVEKGNADGSLINNTFFSGGGMYLDASSGGTADIRIRNCTFRQNFAGGGGAMAIYCVLGGTSEALIENCVFEDNTASTANVTSTGAGILMLGNSGAIVKPKIIGCTFRDNFVGNDGAGISMTPSGAGSFLGTVIDSCLFINNRSRDRGAAIWYRMVSFGNTEVVIRNCQFLNNISGGQGGAVFARSSFSTISNDTIANCLFSQNISDGSSSVNEGEGGAIFIRGSQDGSRDHHIINCVFDRNNASHRGGALGTTSTFSTSGGTCNADVINCSFSGNTTQGEGGAIHAEGSAGLNNLNITNSILWKDSAEVAENEIFNNNATINVSFSDIYQGIPTNVNDNGNNIEQDPEYTDPEIGDLHPVSCSPVINAGDNSAITSLTNIDIDGDPRIHKDTVDLGAFEIGIIYVDATASGVDNGSSWVDAFSDLQDALTVAAAGDQIWVANGTYKPFNCSTCTTPDRLTTFNIPSDVEIYGGFNGSETALEQRDWTVNFSILSGDIGLLGDTTDNSYRVVTAVNSTDKTIFDGLIVEKGNADGSLINNTFFSGGGMYLDASSGGTADIRIRNCTFRQNFAGGGGAMAIYCVLGGTSEALIENCVFEDNTASTANVTSTGAGILMLGNSGAIVKPKIIGCTFRDNFVGNDGAGISMTPSGAGSFLGTVIDSCLFINNRSRDRGAAIWYRMVSFGNTEVVIRNCQFLNNISGGQGGAVFARSSFSTISNDTIANCLFSQNISDGSSSVNEGEGGAIFIRGSQDGSRDHHIINCVFDRNNASHRGGALGTTSTFSTSGGTCNADVINCSFSGNTTQGEGGAIHAEGSAGLNNLNITNSILWKDSAEVAENEIFNNNATINVSFSDIYQGIPTNVNDNGNNIEKDPIFIDPENQDFNLVGCSPAVNAGLNTALPLDRIDLDADGDTNDTIDVDFNGETRIIEEIVDLGAFEWQGNAFKFDSLIFDPVQAATEGLCNGSVKVNPFNGTTPFSFLWSNRESTQQITGLCPDIYSITVSDGFGCVFTDSVRIEEIEVNDPPVFTSDSIVTVLEDSLYSYSITSFDPDVDDKVAITGTTIPTWLTLFDNGDGTAMLYGTPTNEDVGIHNVSINVTDTSGLFSEQIFIVQVINTNDPPSFTSTPVTEASEDQLYIYNITAEDADVGDVLSFTNGGLPAWLTLVDNGDGTATLSGTPSNNDVGSLDIVLTVTDVAGAFDEQGFTLSIENVNDPPAFTSTPILTVDEDILYTYEVSAQDVDISDVLTISQTTMPSWLTLVDNSDGTALLSGIPSDEDVGLQNVILLVTDNEGATDEQSFTIDVRNTNQAPSFTSTPVTKASEDQLYIYNITAKDADVGDVLSFTNGGLPAWLTLVDNGDGTAILSGIPSNDDVGRVDITLIVADAAGAESEQTFSIDVSGVDQQNQIPRVANFQIEGYEDEQIPIDENSYLNNFSDLDNQTLLVISIETLPENGSLLFNGNQLPANTQFAIEDMNEMVYLPKPDFNGSDQLIWNGSDGIDFAAEEAIITIVVNPVNDTPEDILLSNQTIEEGLPPGSLIGTLTTIDVDDSDDHTFELLDGNSGDATDFTIEDDLLLTSTELDFDEKDEYKIVIRSIDAAGSTFEKSFTITVIDVEEVVFQTAITPNGDGFNDTWKIPQLNECDECQVEIFDRWGTNVFSSIGYEEEWDGIRSGSLLQSGTYYFVLDFKNGNVPKTGAISLLR